MNEYDSNRIFHSLKKIGFERTENQENADCVVLNTCHIRDKAKEKVYHELGRVKTQTYSRCSRMCCSGWEWGNVKKRALHRYCNWPTVLS